MRLCVESSITALALVFPSLHWRSVSVVWPLGLKFQGLVKKMLSKITTIARFIPRVGNARCMGHGVPANFKPIGQVLKENRNTMDHMPVPSGSWQEAYSAINSQNNMLLMGSLAMTIVTFALLFQTGCIYFHGPPPNYNKNK